MEEKHVQLLVSLSIVLLLFTFANLVFLEIGNENSKEVKRTCIAFVEDRCSCEVDQPFLLDDLGLEVGFNVSEFQQE